MRKTLLLVLISPLLSELLIGQDFSVPDSIKRECEYKTYKNGNAIWKCKIRRPKNYDKTKEYPVVLALGGGDASEQIVEYCYYLYFRSHYFENSLVIMPVLDSLTLADIDSARTAALMASIGREENVSKKDWLVIGTSMGGLGAFNFARYAPDIFSGIIVFPGGGNFEIPKKWKKYKVVLAVGDKDITPFEENGRDNWYTYTLGLAKRMENKVRFLKTVIMKDQDHVISKSYDVNIVYDAYFGTEK